MPTEKDDERRGTVRTRAACGLCHGGWPEASGGRSHDLLGEPQVILPTARREYRGVEGEQGQKGWPENSSHGLPEGLKERPWRRRRWPQRHCHGRLAHCPPQEWGTTVRPWSMRPQLALLTRTLSSASAGQRPSAAANLQHHSTQPAAGRFSRRSVREWQPMRKGSSLIRTARCSRRFRTLRARRGR